jgi:serine/threonine protein phosphatase PrpC
MEKTINYMKKLLESKGLSVDMKHTQLLSEVCATPEIQESVNSINLIQDKMINAWTRRSKVHDFINAAFSIPNATVGKPYDFRFEESLDLLKGIRILSVEASGIAIVYNQDSRTLTSVFTEPGQFKIEIKFKLEEDQDDTIAGTKEVKLLVNPDPKSLWKNLDSNREDPYWKEDNASASAMLGRKKLIVGSKRGRSHAHEGIFRDDDFSFHFLGDTGWSIISVADGAGGSKNSRKGSQLACNAVTDYFKSIAVEEWDSISDAIIAELQETKEENQRAISSFCIAHLGKAAFGALTAIKVEAESKGALVKDYSTTLIFALVKEFDEKLFITSFWVGDGGIGIYMAEPQSVHLLGVPDSGEFSGQTRFLTMSEIFADNAYISRIKYKIVDKSAKLILMTDGITDAKFQTDAALEKVEVWKGFMEDLGGKNEDNIAIDFDSELKISEESLMKWMDFWSPGNHDDRTMAILY